ncbi:MAG: ferrochelatase [Deltaproteobacteria bacterium]|nr:ferrochelatase [Deltaproteobacteria bacterium]
MKEEGALSRTAVLLLAFGGPRSLDEVGWFLERLLGKRPSPAQIEGLKRRYRSIGNASPLPEMTLRQARTLKERLKKGGQPLRVYVGMRYGHPLIAETLEEINKEKASRIILLSLSPYCSPFTSEGYYEEVKKVVALWKERMNFIQVDDWYAHPCLCAAWAKRIDKTLKEISERGKEVPVIFTAHSLPLDAASCTPYVGQLEETIKGIIETTGPLRWQLAFQSRARGGEWLGPEPETILEELSQKGYKKALIVPVGFICDHLETLYDLDIYLKAWANERGLEIIRVPCLNDSPELIETLAHLVKGALERG